jgi:hypothetical protein
MISFGDDRDYDSLQYDIIDSAGDNTHNNGGGERRARGSSFNIDLDDDDDDDDESGDNNDLIPDDGDDTNDNDDRGINVQQQQRRMMREQQQHQQSQRGGEKPYATNDYGCEVLTFGRVDHCALGVPQLSRRIRSDYNYGKDDSNNFFSASSFDSKTYKPKRVEFFALGELRRSWSSSNYEGSGSSTSRRDRRNEIDSPAVAVAASTHHTLVNTRSGKLFSFGLGKGGRLGLGEYLHVCSIIIFALYINPISHLTNYFHSPN